MHQERFEWFEWADASNSAAHQVDGRARHEELRGEVVFASEEEQGQRLTELLGGGALLITVPPPQHDVRGRLGEVVEELVERELARVGAPSPYLAAWSAMPEDAQARLADQLFRARTVGATGLAIALGSLRAIASPSLTPDDSATLRWLADTTAEAPLVVLVDDADLMVPGYAAPLPLGALLATRKPMWETTPSSVVPVVESVVVVAASETDEVIEAAPESDEPMILTGDDATSNDTRVASIDAVDAILLVQDEPEQEQAPVTISEPINVETIATAQQEHVSPVDPSELPQVIVDSVLATSDDAPAPAPVEAAAPVPEVLDVPVEAAAPVETPVEAAAPVETPVEVAAVATTAREQRRASRRVSAGIPVSGPSDAWRSWAIALAAARGPQPLNAFERLFAESYVPLANAIARGLDDPRALRPYDEFRRSFERSYTDAFTAFGATNRRPRLVMDAYDIASKQARLSNARSSHVLLVDSMRFDLGCLVRDALAREATGAATLTSEMILWSALPTTTMRQIETFARGLDALRAPAREDREEPSESLRGRAAEVVRRLRVGSRELYKLDLVPAMLEGTNDVVGALPEIATRTAEAIARHIATVQPRTLVYVVGDHGFSVDRRGEIKTGGASPEEVLVPAFSWLVGDLH